MVFVLPPLIIWRGAAGLEEDDDDFNEDFDCCPRLQGILPNILRCQPSVLTSAPPLLELRPPRPRLFRPPPDDDGGSLNKAALRAGEERRYKG